MKIKKALNGFTLVEILIVVGIVVVLFSGIVMSSYIFRNQLAFNSAVNNLKNISDEAKNYALSTLSYPDTTNYDGDSKGCEDPLDPATCDKILPNGYIINYDASGERVQVSLYADLFSSTVNSFDTGDQLIKSIELPENINFSAYAAPKGGTGYAMSENFSVLYTQTNAELYLLTTPIAKDSLQLHITQIDSKGNIERDKYIYYQYLNNTAQITDERMIRTSS